jgi:hypothetical protein
MLVGDFAQPNAANDASTAPATRNRCFIAADAEPA